MLYILRHFVFLFENNTNKLVHARCCLPKVEIKYYNVRIDGKKVLDKHVENNIETCENIKKSDIGQEDNQKVEFLLDYPCFLKKLQINTYRSR